MSHHDIDPMEKDYHGHPNYFLVYISLMAFFGVSLMADYLGNHMLAIYLIFGTAFIKMVLVISNFMHLKFEPKSFWLLPIFGAFTILAFIFLVYPDVNSSIARVISK